MPLPLGVALLGLRVGTALTVPYWVACCGCCHATAQVAGLLGRRHTRLLFHIELIPFAMKIHSVWMSEYGPFEFSFSGLNDTSDRWLMRVQIWIPGQKWFSSSLSPSLPPSLSPPPSLCVVKLSHYRIKY